MRDERRGGVRVRSAPRTRGMMLVALALVPPVLGLAAALAGGTGGDGRTVITVLAAASLQAPLQLIAADFERANPGVDIRLSFAGSSRLAAQVRSGVAADVVAVADSETLSGLRRTGHVGPPRAFAGNALVIATPAGNPAAIGDINDLARGGDLRIAVVAAGVPLGRYSRRMLARVARDHRRGFVKRVMRSVVTEAQDARELTAQVALGEIDAAIAYRTDVRASGARASAVGVPPRYQPPIAYEIATLTRSRHPRAADRFTAMVGGRAGAARLRAAGFLPAPSANRLSAQRAKVSSAPRAKRPPAHRSKVSPARFARPPAGRVAS